jgi:hypothetical protein
VQRSGDKREEGRRKPSSYHGVHSTWHSSTPWHYSLDAMTPSTPCHPQRHATLRHDTTHTPWVTLEPPLLTLERRPSTMYAHTPTTDRREGTPGTPSSSLSSSSSPPLLLLLLLLLLRVSTLSTASHMCTITFLSLFPFSPSSRLSFANAQLLNLSKVKIKKGGSTNGRSCGSASAWGVRTATTRERRPRRTADQASPTPK